MIFGEFGIICTDVMRMPFYAMDRTKATFIMVCDLVCGSFWVAKKLSSCDVMRCRCRLQSNSSCAACMLSDSEAYKWSQDSKKSEDDCRIVAAVFFDPVLLVLQ